MKMDVAYFQSVEGSMTREDGKTFMLHRQAADRQRPDAWLRSVPKRLPPLSPTRISSGPDDNSPPG